MADTILFPAPAVLTYTGGQAGIARALSPAPAILTYTTFTAGVTTVIAVPTSNVGPELNIAGTVRALAAEPAANITKTLSAAWPASFSFIHTSGGSLPSPGEEVAFFWDGTKRFGGVVLNYTEASYPGSFTTSLVTVQCSGFQSYMDRAIVAKLYTISLGGVYAITIFDIWSEHLAQFGISIAYPQGPIVAMPEDLYWYVTVSEAYQRIKSANAGWDYFIDDNKALTWGQSGTLGAAGFTLRNSDHNVDTMEVTLSNERFRNKQWVLPSIDIVALRTDSAVGDGSTIAFATQYILTSTPNVSVGGVVQTVSELSTLAVGWTVYYIAGGIGVFFNTAPGIGVTVDISYPSPFPVGFSVQDDVSIAAKGLYEAVYQAKNVNDEDTCLALAQGLLDLYGTDGDFPQAVRFTYNSSQQASWLTPGMTIDVDRTFPTALGIYQVEQVSSVLEGLTVWKHSVTLRAGLGDVTDEIALEAFRTSGRLAVVSPPFRATFEIGQDIPGITNPGISTGLISNVFIVPQVSGQSTVTVASWDAIFPTDPPTGDDFIADFLVNGVSIFPSGDANKMVIPDGDASLVSGIRFLTDNILLSPGAIVTMNVIQVGSTNPGKNAVFHLNFKV